MTRSSTRVFLGGFAFLYLFAISGLSLASAETRVDRFSGQVRGIDGGERRGAMHFNARFDASELPETDFRENATLTFESVLLSEDQEELILLAGSSSDALSARGKVGIRRAHFRSTGRAGSRIRASVHRRGDSLNLKFRIGRATIESSDLCEEEGDFVLLQTEARLGWETNSGSEETSLLTVQPWVCRSQSDGRWRLHANGHQGYSYNRPPSARLVVTNLSDSTKGGKIADTGTVKSVIRLDSRDSYDPDGKVAKYQFGVTHIASGEELPALAAAADAVVHVHLPPGAYQAHVTATDDGGETDSAVHEIVIAGEAAAHPASEATGWGRGPSWVPGDRVVVAQPGHCPGGGEPNASGECASLVGTRTLKAGEIRLRTVNYNVFGRWQGLTGMEGQVKRLSAIPQAIKSHPKMGPDVDVITIAEAWCKDPNGSTTNGIVCSNNKSRSALKQAFSDAGWQHSSKILWDPGEATKLVSGGVIVFSKWPLEAHNQFVYSTCASGTMDCHAAKGAEYIKIVKTDPETKVKQAFNIFGTHLQAWSTEAGKTARAGQLHELRDTYLPALRIPETGSEVVIFQGDMNTDFVLHPEEVATMKSALHAELPTWVGDQPFSSDPSTNFLVGKDGAAKTNGCETAYRNSLNTGHAVPAEPAEACTNVPTHAASSQAFNPRFRDQNGHLNVGTSCKAFCPCCPHESLDYILYSSDAHHLQPLASSLEIIPLKAKKPLTYQWGWEKADTTSIVEALAEKPSPPRPTTTVTGSDLSDHYPVVANFIFKPSATEFAPYDGCKQDSSCKPGSGWSFSSTSSNELTCYCWGDNCTVDGRSRDGRKDHPNSTINENCHWRESSVSERDCFCRPGDE